MNSRIQILLLPFAVVCLAFSVGCKIDDAEAVVPKEVSQEEIEAKLKARGGASLLSDLKKAKEIKGSQSQ